MMDRRSLKFKGWEGGGEDELCKFFEKGVDGPPAYAYYIPPLNEGLQHGAF